MKLRLSSLSICRSPIFSVDEQLENVWQQLKEYIHESSPSFFEVIKNDDYAAFEKAAVKTKFTVWKYFNRAKFRPTPFGNFAAFSVVPVGTDHLLTNIIVARQPVLHRFANWQEKEHINFDPKWLTHNSSYFRANTTIYECEGDLRFINVDEGSFELSAIINDHTAQALLSFCKLKRSLLEIQQYMKLLQLSKTMVNYLVEQLILFQLLLTDYQPNIIGTDYFKRIGQSSTQPITDYIIAEKTCLAGHLNEKWIKVLIELTEFLNSNGIQNRSPALDSFKEAFLKRFEGKEVPLLSAMDPEMGIGYLSLIHDKNDDALVQELKSNQSNQIDQIAYSALHQFILNRFIEGKTVQLEEMKAVGAKAKKPVANTISILFRPSDELLLIEQIGGSTANALLGRFTMATDQVAEMGKHFARVEQQANPEVIFFDVAYQMEKNADNINRRKALYTHELPILSWTDGGEILDLNDLLLSVKDNELMLRSKSLNKRVVPKLASAYNYARSDLAVYRFLSDLQHQNLHSSLAIDIVQLFPGLSHYRRIQYKNVVLSPEKWLLPQQFCKGYESPQTILDLREWLFSIALQQPFKCGQADQTLLFNPLEEDDLRALLFFCKQKQNLYIEEALLPNSVLIRDEHQRPYLSEFIVNLEHDGQIYKPISQDGSAEKPRNKVFLPGDQWLYFEIYCYKSKSNQLLSSIASTVIPAIKSKVKNWFFIRYNDPSNHIRFRLQLKDNADSGTVITAFSELIKPYFDSGTVSDLQLKPYCPEFERYGAGRMHKVEKYFNASSKLVLYLIAKQYTTNELYALSIAMMQHIWDRAGLSPAEQLVFADRMASYFSEEMKIGPEGFKKLNQHFKTFDISTHNLHINKLQVKKTEAVESSFLQVLALCTEEERQKMMSDLIHMHINRLFNTDQRMHEYIFYYYLGRKLRTKISLIKKEQPVII